MIKIARVYKRFGEHAALCDVSCMIEERDVFGIVGHSGAGKSTLLRCINGLEKYDEGSVKVMGREVSSLHDHQLKELRREIGMIFQNFNLMSRKNVFENIAFPMEVWGVPRPEIASRVEELLELVGLTEKRNEKIRNLSGGQKQRVGIARALTMKPKILLCDEPTSALDPKTTISILDLLMDINVRLGITIVIVTHQMEVVKRACNKVVLMDGGKVVGSGNTEELFLAPDAELKKLIRDEYAFIPSGINIRLMFPREIANESIITNMTRDLGINFSIVGGRIERYRDVVMGFLIINVKEQDLDVVLEYMQEKKLFWEVLSNGD